MKFFNMKRYSYILICVLLLAPFCVNDAYADEVELVKPHVELVDPNVKFYVAGGTDSKKRDCFAIWFL